MQQNELANFEKLLDSERILRETDDIDKIFEVINETLSGKYDTLAIHTAKEMKFLKIL